MSDPDGPSNFCSRIGLEGVSIQSRAGGRLSGWLIAASISCYLGSRNGLAAQSEDTDKLEPSALEKSLDSSVGCHGRLSIRLIEGSFEI